MTSGHTTSAATAAIVTSAVALAAWTADSAVLGWAASCAVLAIGHAVAGRRWALAAATAAAATAAAATAAAATAAAATAAVTAQLLICAQAVVMLAGCGVVTATVADALAAAWLWGAALVWALSSAAPRLPAFAIGVVGAGAAAAVVVTALALTGADLGVVAVVAVVVGAAAGAGDLVGRAWAQLRLQSGPAPHHQRQIALERAFLVGSALWLAAATLWSTVGPLAPL
ncbi:MAG: hypothetical protein EXR77_05235 [Myxococcales bacterium]|nr:hypothetical protein [Myxococcales bacterium]